MKEADVVAQIHAGFKQQLPRAVYLKLNDLSTTGIPDLEVTYGGRTTHVEVKYLRQGETASQFKKHFAPLQLATCRLLEQQGRCVYLVAVEQDLTMLIRPHQLAYYLDRGAKSAADLHPAAFHRSTLALAIDHLVWKVRQP